MAEQTPYTPPQSVVDARARQARVVEQRRAQAAKSSEAKAARRFLRGFNRDKYKERKSQNVGTGERLQGGQMRPADALTSQFQSRVRAPKAFDAASGVPPLLDPVGRIPVLGSIGGTGVDMSPLTQDNAQRRSFAVEVASHNRAVAQMSQEGATIQANMDMAKAARRAQEIQDEIKNRLDIAAEERLSKQVANDAAGIKLREREISRLEKDTPESRLDEDKKRIQQRQEATEAYDAKKEAKDAAKRQRQASVDKRTREFINAAGEEYAKAGDPNARPASAQVIIDRIIAATPNARGNAVMEQEIAESVHREIKRRDMESRVVREAKEAEEEEALALQAEYWHADSIDNSYSDDFENWAKETNNDTAESFLESLNVALNSTDPRTAGAALENIRAAGKHFNLNQILVLKSQVGDNLQRLRTNRSIEAEVYKNEVKAASAARDNYNLSPQERSAAEKLLAELRNEENNRLKEYAASRDALQGMESYIKELERTRKGVLTKAAAEEAKRRGVERANAYLRSGGQNYDTMTNAGPETNTAIEE